MARHVEAPFWTAAAKRKRRRRSWRSKPGIEIQRRRSQGSAFLSADFRLPQRGNAYQPRVRPWESVGKYRSVLKERRMGRAWRGDAAVCRVPSERMNGYRRIPRAAPGSGLDWYAMPRWGNPLPFILAPPRRTLIIRFTTRQRMFLPLLGERAGVRASLYAGGAN